MRTLTVNALNKTQTRLATEPVTILAINWSTGIQYYGDKSFTLAPNTVQGKLLEFSPIQATGKQDTSGEVSSASVMLDDVDGTLKALWNTIIMEGTIVSAYHHYEGNAWSDLTLVFRGKIGGTIEWHEGERQLSFDIESYIDDAEIGYAPEEGAIPNMNKDAAGVVWPIVFGGVLKLKAIPLRKGPASNNTDGILGGWPIYESTPFEVENGDQFPQDTPMYLVVNQTIFHGHFEGKMFHRDISNIPWYEHVEIDTRPQQDEDSLNPKVVWIKNGENLYKKQCWLGPNSYNYCDRQEGNKCWFRFDWNHLLTDTDIEFKEISGNVHSYWYTDPTYLNFWYIYPRCPVYQYNKDYQDLYIVNQYPSSQIVEVYAWRTYDGQEIFAPVPSSYYTIHYNYSIGGHNVTAIEFPIPLATRESEQWKDEIFVSVRSTLPSNVADIIQWVVQNYTSYGVDTASFAQARLDVAPYPANFALLDKKNVIDFIEEIAWQARCAIFVHNGVISLKYLSKDMPVDYTMGRPDILLKTLRLGFVPTEEIKTKLTGTWLLDYSGRDEVSKKIIYSNNINLFGLRTDERSIYIYNIEELVKMTVYFWGYRYSNSWRTAQYPTLLRTLALELFDCVNHDLGVLSAYMIRGIIEDISHDSVANEISLRLELASKAAQHLGGEPIEDPYFWIGDPSYVVTPRAIVDPLSGLTIVDYVPPVIKESTNKTNTKDNSNQAPDSFKYVFVLPTQDEIERGVNFPVKIQLQDILGKRIYNTVNATLSLGSADTADRLSGGVTELPITLTNGEYYVTNMQIINGTTMQYGAYLSCSDADSRDNYATGTSEPFDIIALKAGTITWVTSPPATVNRGELFPVNITGAADGEILDVTYLNADPLDKLYNEAGVEVTTIGFGPTGYSANWYISGGGGADINNQVLLSDSRYQAYADSPSSLFAISGSEFAFSLVQTFTVNPLNRDELDEDEDGTNGGGLLLNPPNLDLSFISGEVNDNVVFRLKTQVLDAEGSVVDFDGQVTLYAFDADGTAINWLSPGTGLVLFRTMTDGVLEEDYKISLTALNVSPITFVAEVTYQGVLLQAILTKDFILSKILLQTVEVQQFTEKFDMYFEVTAPAQITRGVAFNLVVQAKIGDTYATGYSPPNDLTITLLGGNGETPTPNVVSMAGWSNGAKTTSVTVNGGTGNKVLTIEVED